MHGFFDSVHVPLRLPPSHPGQAKAVAKGKGKEVAGGKEQLLGTYDVVASWTHDERDEMRRKVDMAALLGYSTVLLTLNIPATFDPSLLVFPTPLFPDVDPRTAPSGTQGLVMQLWRITVDQYGDEAVKGAGQKGWYGFANSTAGLYPPHTTLLSVAPTSLTSFTHVALSLSPPSPFSPTLVTLDPSLSPRLPFPLKRGLISSLSRAGVSFELVLRGVTRLDGPGDAPGDAGKRRRNWIAGAREVVRATEGRGVVVSSGAVRAGEMRAPEDLINLCALIGMPPAQAKDALTVNPQRAVMRGLSLRQTYRGVLSNPTLLTHAADPAAAPPVLAARLVGAPAAAPAKRPAAEAASAAEEEAAVGGKKGRKKKRQE
ncbi:RNA-binding RNA processing protein rpp1 [Rhodotorula kratochvilovae]